MASHSKAKARAQLTNSRAQQREVVNWLRSHACPLQSVTAGHDFTDLQPLERILRDVRIVGLGEATHGTREFFQFKHRLLEFLVCQMDCRVFGIEASYAACFNINDYIMGRTRNGTKALDSQGFWTWNTREVRDMLDWLRRYNAGVSTERKVRFVGFDFQVDGRGSQEVLNYLKTVASERVAEMKALFNTNLEQLGSSLHSQNESERQEALAQLRVAGEQAEKLLGFLTFNEVRFARQTSASEFNQVRECARAFSQRVDFWSRWGNRLSSMCVRDYYMAENIKRLLDAEPPDSRLVIWAHNGHVVAEASTEYRSMGYHLRQFFGTAYYALGFSFNQGAFQARNLDPAAKRALTVFSVGAAPKGSIDWYLSQTGVTNFILDLRITEDSALRNEAIAEWLATPHPMRSIEAMYSAHNESKSFVPIILQQEFDGLVFFSTTTSAQPNPSVSNIAAPPAP